MERSLACVCLVCTAVYVTPLLHGPWEFILSWDDSINFAENDAIRHLDWQHFRAMLLAVRIGVYEPLAHLLKAIVYAGYGLNSQAVRIASLGLHAASCYVLREASIEMLALLAPSSDAAATALGCTLSAFLFFIHPLNVEVVAWPSAQPYALALFFTSLSYYVHVTNWQLPVQKGSAMFALVRRVLPTVLYGCAVLSKSVTVVTPVGLVFIDAIVYLQRHSKVWSVRALAMQLFRSFVGFGVVGVLTIWAMVTSNKGGDSWEADPLHIPFPERVVKAFVMVTWTLQAWIWPAELRAHYQLRRGEMNISTNAASLLSVAATIGMTMWCVSRRLTSPSVLAAWTYYLAMFLPVCGLVQHGIITLTADRYTFFPTVVAIPLLGAGIARATTVARNASFVCVAAVAIVFAVLSARQMSAWRDDEALWLHNIQQDPADWRALDHLADYYAKIGRVQECRPYWERSLWHMPRAGLKAMLQEARLLMYLGRYDEGCALYASALHHHPRSTHLLNNMGICYLQWGKYDLAKQSFHHAVAYAVGLSGVEGVDTSTPQLNLNQLNAWDGQAHYHANLMW